jgi:hypothetical protein
MPGVGARWPDPILTTIDDGTDGTKAKRQEMTSTLTHIAAVVACLAILVSWLTVVSSRGLLTGLVASLAFGAAAALLLTAARSLG